MHRWLCDVSKEHRLKLRKVSMVLQQPRRRLRMLSLTRKATCEKPQSCSLLFQTAASHGGSCMWNSSRPLLDKKSLLSSLSMVLWYDLFHCTMCLMLIGFYFWSDSRTANLLLSQLLNDCKSSVVTQQWPRVLSRQVQPRCFLQWCYFVATMAQSWRRLSRIRPS